MTWRSFFEGLGDFFDYTFQILPALGNSVNYFFMAVGTVMFIYWLGQMRKHAKAGEH